MRLLVARGALGVRFAEEAGGDEELPELQPAPEGTRFRWLAVVPLEDLAGGATRAGRERMSVVECERGRQVGLTGRVERAPEDEHFANRAVAVDRVGDEAESRPVRFGRRKDVERVTRPEVEVNGLELPRRKRRAPLSLLAQGRDEADVVHRHARPLVDGVGGDCARVGEEGEVREVGGERLDAPSCSPRAPRDADEQERLFLDRDGTWGFHRRFDGSGNRMNELRWGCWLLGLVAAQGRLGAASTYLRALRFRLAGTVRRGALLGLFGQVSRGVCLGVIGASARRLA